MPSLDPRVASEGVCPDVAAGKRFAGEVYRIATRKVDEVVAEGALPAPANGRLREARERTPRA